ncbi:MAG: hypothetical protein ACJ759_07415 [Thermoanaerobaculia bacterium]
MRDEELLRQYLLGELSGEDEALLEARLIQDDGLFERAEAMEAELLDEHAHGRLSASQGARIRRHLASSPATRSQLAVVRGLGTVAQDETPGRRILTGPWGRVDTSRPRTRALAAAAMLVMGVGAVWLAVQTPSIPEMPARKAAQRAGEILPQPPRAPETITATPSPVVIAQVEPTPAPVPTPAPAPEPAPWLFEIALTSITRGEGEVPKKPVPAPGTKRAEIEISLGAGYMEYDSYEVLLSRPGETVFQEQGLKPREQKLVLEIDPGKLQEGTYTLVVNGAAPDRPAELLAELEIDLEPAK